MIGIDGLHKKFDLQVFIKNWNVTHNLKISSILHTHGWSIKMNEMSKVVSLFPWFSSENYVAIFGD